jgi:hypothetical protein
VGLFGKLFGPEPPPETPAEGDYLKLAMAWDVKKLERLMTHPEASVRSKVVAVVAMVGKMKPVGNQVIYRPDNKMAAPMCTFLLKHARDQDPAVREEILKALEASHVPEVEAAAKKLRAG